MAGPLSKGAKVLFDLSKLREVPGVPQFPLERYDPPRGRPKTLDSITTPENARRLEEIARQGMDMGGPEWYNLEPLRQQFVAEMGDEEGNRLFRRYVDYVAATSPRSKVDSNIRRGSYFYNREMQGLPVANLKNADLPKGYGHLAHETQNALLRDLEGGGSFAALNRPKTSSFAENLAGNQVPMTLDTHNMALVSGKKVSPSDTQYKYLEEFQAEIADKVGLTPAQFQASLWVAGDTGVANPRPFMEIFDQVVERTAQRDKKSKKEALRDFITGKAPLFGLGGAMAGVITPEEAEAAGFGTLARAIGQGTRRVFTGSPAEYTQPSLQKIGTGEGNQAFGYGLYFSESPGVATGYRKILSGEKLIKRLEDQELDPDLYAEDVSEMLDEGVFGEAETRFLRALEEADYLGFDHPYQAVRATFSPRMGFDMGDEAVVNLLKMRDEMGFLYETEIPADTFLDWDLPLADQPAIVQRVVDEVARRQPERFDATMMRRYQEGKMKGKEAYYLFSQNPQEASQVWANYGVPGVRYSSQGRRSAAQKEMIPQNYVVFDDKLINMVSRNDVPLEGNFDEAAARQALDPEMLRSRLRQMGPVGTVAASAGAVASPLDRQDDVPDYMRRLDGTVKSQRGFLGPIRNNVSGKTMTEVSMGQPGSEEGFYPLLVPTLTPEEVETIANIDLERERPPFSIIEKARAHALERIDRGLSPFYQDGEEGGAVRSPLERPEAAERRANARAVAVASDTLERLRRERGPRMAPLRSNFATAVGDYMTENRPSEMDPVQRALQNLDLYQGLGEYIRTAGEGQRTTTMQNINAALDIVPL